MRLYKVARHNTLIFLGVTLIFIVSAGLWIRKNLVSIYIYRLASGRLFLMEDFNNSELQNLRRREHLDSVVRPSAGDIENLLALAQWTSKLFPASTPFPNYPPFNALRTLEMIRKKMTGGFCAQYAYIFGQASQSFGFTPSYALGSPIDKLTDGHVLTEVYVPSLKKWVAFDAQYGYY